MIDSIESYKEFFYDLSLYASKGKIEIKVKETVQTLNSSSPFSKSKLICTTINNQRHFSVIPEVLKKTTCIYEQFDSTADRSMTSFHLVMMQVQRKSLNVICN